MQLGHRGLYSLVLGDTMTQRTGLQVVPVQRNLGQSYLGSPGKLVSPRPSPPDSPGRTCPRGQTAHDIIAHDRAAELIEFGHHQHHRYHHRQRRFINYLYILYGLLATQNM